MSLHQAVQLLSGVRLLFVDDAHLLDDASAALVHQLAVHGRTRLLVVATEGAQAPGAVSRLWTGEVLPRLTLEPLPRLETAQLLAAGVGGLEALTVNRLYRLCRGDLRLLRDLVGAVREQGLLERAADSAEWEWRGPVPVTATVRERTAHLIRRTGPGERETLERLAFGEPLPMHADSLDLDALEGLEADGLVHVDEDGTARLAHPLHGPALRAVAGRLRARRLARTPDSVAAALDAETATLSRAIAGTDVRDVPAPVGEWLLDEGVGVPARHAAVRARFARLRGNCGRPWPGRGRDCVPPLTIRPAVSNSPWPRHSRESRGPATGPPMTVGLTLTHPAPFAAGSAESSPPSSSPRPRATAAPPARRRPDSVRRCGRLAGYGGRFGRHLAGRRPR